MTHTPESETIAEGKHLRFARRRGWEFVERPGISGIAVIIPVTANGELVLVQQYRAPLDAQVIELPAGLAGDRDEHRQEEVIAAARRELLEETGYEASQIVLATEGPVGPGLSTEVATFYLATGLERVHAGGGDESESILVHAVGLSAVPAWLRARRQEGLLVDPKVFAGLYFALHGVG